MRRLREWAVARFRRPSPVALVVAALAPLPASAELELSGIDGALRENVLAYLDLDEQGCDAPPWRIEQLFGGAETRIRSALEAFGYYQARVESELERSEGCWHARFDVEPGEPVRLRSFDFRIVGEAESDPLFTAFARRRALEPGQPLNHGDYEALKEGLLNLSRQRGYVDNRFTTSRIDVYLGELAADITLHFDSGPRYAFGAIEFDQDVLSPELVRSYLSFEAGDPFDNRQVTALYTALIDSGFFRTVDVDTGAPDHDRRAIPIDVRLTPGTRLLISYGVGFSTDTGPRLRFGRTNRRRNQNGHQFGISSQLSPVISEITVSYRFPYGDPRTDWISFDGGLRREETDTALSKTLELGVRRVLRPRGSWTRTQFLNLRIEDFEVADQQGRSTLLMPGTSWSRLRADSNIRPRNGSRIDLELRGAGEGLGSDTSFVQAIARGKWIWSLPNQARVIVRGELGMTAEEQFEALPPSVRFFAGGDNSVRGYKFESLGPTDENERVIGGSSLIVGSAEYEHPVRDRWSVAVFVDAGNAFAGTDFELRTGAGLGVRWQSPLGPIRADIAYPLDGVDRSARLHISLGPDL